MSFGISEGFTFTDFIFLPPSASNNTGSGLVTCWDQLTQSLLVGGDSRYIRIWDADKELKTVDIPTGADSSLTSLSLGSKGT